MPKKDLSLGRALIKAHKRRRNIVNKDGYRHTSDLPDGRDFARLNLRSVTEQTSVNDFLDTVALATDEYTSELGDVKIVEPDVTNRIFSEEEKALIASAQEENREILCIPRRPSWDSNTSKEELDKKERGAFLLWRRKLSFLQEKEHINLTPYEKNLEIWRQLWRVIERSDIIVQILDARNPLLFRCSDLETYVKEVDEKKINVLLLNKADFLTEHERKCWCKYFEESGIRIAFFSALQQIENASKDNSMKQTASGNSLTEKGISPISTKEGITSTSTEEAISSTSAEKDIPPTSAEEGSSSISSEENTFSTSTNEGVSHTLIKESLCSTLTEEAISSTKLENNPDILCQDELISFFKSIGKSIEKSNPVLNVGFVGYPNVGKSSTINAILMSKKVSVSRTPGKTKHFQTLFVDKDLCLCDCPGLVFPNFVSTKAEMVINGILPVDELSHWEEPISLVTNLIPRNILESTYSVMLPFPAEGKDINSQPTAEEFLNAYGYNRGYMTQRGLPNNALSARHILKDFIDGKILYCYAPPGMKQEGYHKFPDVRPGKSVQNTIKERNCFSEEERIFFSKQSEVHFKGKKHEMQLDSKGRPSKHHNNKNKHQKLKKKHKDPMY